VDEWAANCPARVIAFVLCSEGGRDIPVVVVALLEPFMTQDDNSCARFGFDVAHIGLTIREQGLRGAI